MSWTHGLMGSVKRGREQQHLLARLWWPAAGFSSRDRQLENLNLAVIHLFSSPGPLFLQNKQSIINIIHNILKIIKFKGFIINYGVNCLCNKSKQSLKQSQPESIEKTLFYSLICNITSTKKKAELYDFLIRNWKEIPSYH